MIFIKINQKHDFANFVLFVKAEFDKFYNKKKIH